MPAHQTNPPRAPGFAAAPTQMAARLTTRDWWLIEMLHTHRVLTSTQVLRLAYTARRTTNARLARLLHYGVIQSFRPLQNVGSAPTHLVLGPRGATVLAARRGTTVRELPWRADEPVRIAHSTHLAHTVGANEVMVRLAAEQRTDPGRALLLWLPARVCAHLWGDWIHPDAFGLHHDTAPEREPFGVHTPRAPGSGARALRPAFDRPEAHPEARTTGFFLEYDRSTEPAWRVAAKLDGYAAHAAGTRTRTPLLIHTPTATRERLLRTRLADHAADLDLPVATTHAHLAAAEQPLHLHRFDHDTGPTAADPVWLPLTAGPDGADPHLGVRLRLVDLAGYFGLLVPALDPAVLGPDADHSRLDVEPVPPPLPPRPGGRSRR